NYEPEELTISGTQWTYSKDNVPAGQYIIKFEVYDVSDKLLNTLTDVIEVIGGITTTDQITLNKINTQYTITYNLDGGNWKSRFFPVTERNANTKITLPTTEDIEKENFIFAGWYDENGNKITQIPSDTTGNITITARWWLTEEAAIKIITELSESEPCDIVIGGEITNDTISAIKTALQNNSSAMVNLDLSETTGLTSIENWAFGDCNSLTSVTIPDSVTSIDMKGYHKSTVAKYPRIK
ncbi:MAG: InlB B-repeat-containing protein, partial [Spirochaetales bacterium]|nr:InlB B-repeat-containing protein [Spirochaetales bacterium]